MRTIVFYISGHGFGHASRDIEVINALLARQPDLRIVVHTTAARWLFNLTVRGAFRYQQLECDTGLVQIDSLRLDAEESVRRAADFMATFDQRVARESTALRGSDVALVVADMPPLGIAAAAAAGIPAAALGNFSWDWAYSAYSGSEALVRSIATAYAHADVAIRLPMWGGFHPFRNIVDIPFVARQSQRDRTGTRRALGLPLDKPVVLASFGGHGLEGLDLEALGQLERYVFLFSSSVPAGATADEVERHRGANVVSLDEDRLYAQGLLYEDVIRAVDVVVSKPGYGIIAECLANETALLYTSRGHFIEYDVLVAAMPRFLRAAFIDQADLFAGRWVSHLDGLLAQPDPPERPATNGAEVAAEVLLGMV